jgi:hypothetical protein
VDVAVGGMLVLVGGMVVLVGGTVVVGGVGSAVCVRLSSPAAITGRALIGNIDRPTSTSAINPQQEMVLRDIGVFFHAVGAARRRHLLMLNQR